MIAAAVPDVKLVAPEDDAARMKKVVTVEEVLLVVTCMVTSGPKPHHSLDGTVECSWT